MTHGLEPLPADIERLLASERGAVAANEDLRRRALARASVAAAGGHRGMMIPSALRARWLLAAVAAAMATVALAATVRSRKPSQPSSPARGPNDDMAVEPVRPPPAAIDEPAQPERTEVSPPAPPQPSRVVPAARATAAASSDGYDVELRLLEPAREAVAHRAFDRALSALAEHRRRFPAGQLAEERDALIVKALVGLGRVDEARRAAARFRTTHPNGVLLPLVQQAVDGVP